MNIASELQSGVVTISAQVLPLPLSKKKKKVESELAELALDERIEYLKALGINESGLGNLIRTTYALLGLRTYTSGEKVAYDDFVATGSFAIEREKGLVYT